jgi:hypothetical protein
MAACRCHIISENQKTLAFTMDSGIVGVVDLTTVCGLGRTRLCSFCATVRFISDRPSELISGGYDSTLFHFDFTQGTVLSRRTFSRCPFTVPLVRTRSHTTPFSGVAATA